MDRFQHRGVAGWTLWVRHLLFVCCVWQVAVVAAQSNTTRNGTLDLIDAQTHCVGVFLQYQVLQPPAKIPPFATTKEKQPYSFESSVTLSNFGYLELELWELSLGFQYNEIIAKANDVLFLEGITPPGFVTTGDTKIVGVTTPNLLTSIATAEDLTLISTKFNFTGTEFGFDVNGSFPLPTNMSLVNDGYSCAGNVSGVVPATDMWVCCSENATAINGTDSEGSFAPRQSGDITMSFDVNPAVGTYTARVSILMNDPIGRIDNWNLTWQWTHGEIISSMKGGQVLGGSDQDLCIYGVAATALAGQDFSLIMSCSPNPVMIDLDQYTSIDSTDYIPHCCRNGTLLPDLINPLQSRSDFQVTVLKLPPHLALDDITPPSNWNIGEGYTCQQPLRVSPAEFTPEDLHSTSAAASWQVVCNRTVEVPQFPKKCCVSFSAYYNDSVIPCPTCSCGCSNAPTFPWNGQTCNPNIDALLLPYQAVPLPPSNRTLQATELAKLDHYKIPDQSTNPPQPLPCPDNCGVSLNWHVYSDYTNGWSSRITLFNWDKQPVVNWSAAIQMPRAMPGYQNTYSFNGTLVPDVSEFNNTLFIQGHTGYDNFYLNGKDDDDIPGKLQSIISFDKRKTPGIHVPLITDGFPEKVWFNGEECRIAESVPGGDAWRVLPTFQFLIVIAVTCFLMAGESIRFL